MINKKTISIFGSFCGFNKGDLAIISSMVENLSSSKLDIIISSKRPEEIKKFIPHKNVKLYKSITSYLGLNILTQLRNSDLLIFGGGGLFFDRKLYNPFYSHIVNLYIITLINKLFFKKPVYIFSVGASHLEGKIAKKITKFILENANIITVRDENSKAILSKLTDKTIGINRDPAFLLKPKENLELKSYLNSKFSSTQKNILLTLHEGMFKMKNLKNQEQTFFSFLNNLRSMGRIFLFQNDTEFSIINKYRDDLLKLDNVIILDFPHLSPQEIVWMISKFDLSISAPMHFLIMSYLTNTPALAINYDDKVKCFTEYTGIKQIDLNSSEQEIKSLLETPNMNLDPKIIHSAKSNFCNIKSFIENERD